MIPNYQDRQIDSNGITDMASFGISPDDSAHIMTILRDTLYSDKVLAVLREYSANAWDAHNMVGKGDVPIKVTIPTLIEPTLTIQDFGPGLSHQEVFEVYTQYGASTKRNSNVAVGQLGIGSKSGFAYSDSFTIVSCNGGKRRTYVAILDDTEKGTINLLDEADCGDETGVSIQIAIRPDDIEEFTDKATDLFRFFNPRPDINIDLPAEIPVKMRLKAGMIYDKYHEGGEWLAIMGCIPYRLNLSQINVTDDADDKTGVGYWVTKLSGVLFFDIGEVHISASREELKYSKSTKKVIIDRFSELIDEFVSNTLEIIDSNSISSWDKRLRSQILSRFDLPVPSNCKHLINNYVLIQDTPENFGKTFTFKHKDQTGDTSRIQVISDARVVLVDDSRKIKGFWLKLHDYLVFKNNETSSWDDIIPELEEYLKKYSLDGIQVVKLSEQQWVAPYVAPVVKKAINPKHSRKSFTLRQKKYHRCPFSDSWEVTDPNRVATNEDVFVLLRNFKTDGSCGFDIYKQYQRDYEILDLYGLTMPVIYGYKDTVKSPIKIEDCTGVYYLEWRTKFMEELANGKAKADLELYDWQQLFERDWLRPIDIKEVVDTLGSSHLITQTFKKIKRASKKWSKIIDRHGVIRNLSKIYFSDPTKSISALTINSIIERYPLLDPDIGDLSALVGSHGTQWIEYVKMIDRVTPPLNTVAIDPETVDEGDTNDD